MTRETKLGLAVGTSFVSLLAVVAYHGWSKPTDPPTPPDVQPPQVAAAKPVQPPATGGPGLATPGIMQTAVQDLQPSDPAKGPLPSPGSPMPTGPATMTPPPSPNGFTPPAGPPAAPLPGALPNDVVPAATVK